MHACILQGFPTINQATENWFAEALQKVILTTQRLVITVQVFVSSTGWLCSSEIICSKHTWNGSVLHDYEFWFIVENVLTLING